MIYKYLVLLLLVLQQGVYIISNKYDIRGQLSRRRDVVIEELTMHEYSTFAQVPDTLLPSITKVPRVSIKKKNSTLNSNIVSSILESRVVKRPKSRFVSSNTKFHVVNSPIPPVVSSNTNFHVVNSTEFPVITSTESPVITSTESPVINSTESSVVTSLENNNHKQTTQLPVIKNYKDYFLQQDLKESRSSSYIHHVKSTILEDYGNERICFTNLFGNYVFNLPSMYYAGSTCILIIIPFKHSNYCILFES